MGIDHDEVLERWAAGKQSSAEIAADLGLKRGAVVRNIASRAREESGGTDARAMKRPSHHDILRVKGSVYGQAKDKASARRKR